MVHIHNSGVQPGPVSLPLAHRVRRSPQSRFATIVSAVAVLMGLTSAAPGEDAPVPASDRQISDLLRSANGAPAPDDALKLYADFLSQHTVTSEQESRIAEQVTTWEERKQRGLVRLGANWVTEATAQAAVTQANQLMLDGLRAIQQRELRQGYRLLERASEVNPNDAEPDFILGLLYSPRGAYDASKSAQHFRKANARAPQQVAILNNLALAELKVREWPKPATNFSRAVDCWTAAVELDPACPAVSHNLGRVVSEARLGKLPALPQTGPKLEMLYRKVTVQHGAPAMSLRKGWLYMPLETGRKTELQEQLDGDPALVDFLTQPVEDRTCSICNGHGSVSCPQNGCVKGQVTVLAAQRKVELGRRVVTIQVPTRQPCPTCRSAARVECPGQKTYIPRTNPRVPQCDKGRDRSLDFVALDAERTP